MKSSVSIRRYLLSSRTKTKDDFVSTVDRRSVVRARNKTSVSRRGRRHSTIKTDERRQFLHIASQVTNRLQTSFFTTKVNLRLIHLLRNTELLSCLVRTMFAQLLVLLAMIFAVLATFADAWWGGWGYGYGLGWGGFYGL